MRNNTSRRAKLVALFLSTASVCLAYASSDANAAGLYFSDRGVRPLGRGGAFVAGADDLGAVWYNPAGLADAGTTLMIDLSWLNYSSEFTRRTQVLDSQNTLRVYQYPTISGSSPLLPLPTLGGTYNFGDKKEFTIAGAVHAPYTAITSYPATLDSKPSPSRYSLISLDGSALVVVGGYIAYKPIEQVRIGLGLQMLTGSFRSTVVFGASPADRLIGAPEDPKYDAYSELNVGPIFAPSGNLGVTVVPHPRVRIGASGQLPFWVNAPATIKVRLPTAAPFDKAVQTGEDARVRFKLPGVLRVGVEVKPIDDLKVEFAYVREFWSSHSSIDIVPENINLNGITGFPSPFGVSPISLARNFQDSNSFRLGGEGSIRLKDYTIDLRGGVNYESSAIPNDYVSPLTIDSEKVTAAIGGSIHINKHWRLDAVVAHIFGFDVDVAPQDAKVPRVNPVKGNPTDTESINGGTYSARATVLGVGVQYKF